MLAAPDGKESEVEPSPQASEPRRFPVAAVVFGVIVAAVIGLIAYNAATHRDPVDVVEDYLTAVAEKDLEAAYALVSPYGYGVPYGDKAVFLAPEAISDDWWVVSVEEIEREYSSSARVRAVIAGPGGTASGEFEVDEYDDEWKLSDPFVRVRFPASPLAYIQVNDKIVPRKNTIHADYETFVLFPGPYRFYDSVPEIVGVPETKPVAAFPQPEDASSRDDKIVFPQSLTAERKTVEKARQAVKKHIDDCAEYATATPTGCPFATDGEIDTTDGKRVTALHTLKWTVQTYPTVRLSDDRADNTVPGFTVVTEKPGTVTLTGTGRDTEDNPTTFTVTCDIDMTGTMATLSKNGDVTLGVSQQIRSGSDAFNTCRRNA